MDIFRHPLAPPLIYNFSPSTPHPLSLLFSSGHFLSPPSSSFHFQSHVVGSVLVSLLSHLFQYTSSIPLRSILPNHAHDHTSIRVTVPLFAPSYPLHLVHPASLQFLFAFLFLTCYALARSMELHAQSRHVFLVVRVIHLSRASQFLSISLSVRSNHSLPPIAPQPTLVTYNFPCIRISLVIFFFSSLESLWSCVSLTFYLVPLLLSTPLHLPPQPQFSVSVCVIYSVPSIF